MFNWPCNSIGGLVFMDHPVMHVYMKMYTTGAKNHAACAELDVYVKSLGVGLGTTRPVDVWMNLTHPVSNLCPPLSSAPSDLSPSQSNHFVFHRPFHHFHHHPFPSVFTPSSKLTCSATANSFHHRLLECWNPPG